LAHYAADGTPLEQIAYTYDVNGRRSGMSTSVGPHAYRYDATGQLLGATAPAGANESFAYDPVGNRLAANGTAYTVNALNQYTAVGAATFTYDADGNLATRSDADGTTTYTYDAESRLVGVTRPDGAAWNCIYDALGNRVEVNDNGTVSRYVFDPVGLTDLAAEYDAAGSLVRRYLHAGWLAADETADGARRYYHADALSSTRLLTDDTGAVVATRDYTAFGQLKTATGEDTPFGYVGGLGVLADATGLLHMRNRDYAPAEGRFVQLDPIGINAGDVNLYRYCGNGPVGAIDPMGLDTCEQIKVNDPNVYCYEFPEVPGGVYAGDFNRYTGKIRLNSKLPDVSGTYEHEKQHKADLNVKHPDGGNMLDHVDSEIRADAAMGWPREKSVERIKRFPMYYGRLKGFKDL
jgi:RHS repeat-associated protein